MKRMSDERLAVMGRNALLVALKAERQRVEELEGWVFELSGKSDDREAWKDKAEAAEAKLEAVRVLADSWVGTWAETCADELEALLSHEQTK